MTGGAWPRARIPRLIPHLILHLQEQQQQTLVYIRNTYLLNYLFIVYLFISSYPACHSLLGSPTKALEGEKVRVSAGVPAVARRYAEDARRSFLEDLVARQRTPAVDLLLALPLSHQVADRRGRDGLQAAQAEAD